MGVRIMADRRFPILVCLLAFAGSAVADPDDADPDVVPAQFTTPAGPVPGGPTAPAGPAPVADPPTPVVRVQVRVPAHTAPGKDVTYRITVANPSAAIAHRVRVRFPLPVGVAAVTKCDPPPDKFDPKAPGVPPKELAWDFGKLKAGEKHDIELTVRPTADAKELHAEAYVAFEHGQAVVTRVDKAKLSVRKAAPKSAVSTDPVTVRVEVTNPGKVAVANVQLVEDISKGFEFARDTEGEKGTVPEQRVWQVGTLRPGERKVIEYRLTAKDGAADALTTSSVVKSPDAPDGERIESTTKLLVPGLKVDLSGPPNAAPGDPAIYEVVVRNTGTLPLANVRVTGSVPSDCSLSKMTTGGERYRDHLVWTIPSLKPGDAQSFRYGLKANTTGKRTIRAAAEVPRGPEKSSEVVTAFQGTAVLTWDAKSDQFGVATGASGLLTITVKNSGGEAARGVRLRVELPPQVRFVQASPRNDAAANEVVFDPVTVPAYGTEKYTLTFRGERAGQAWFRLKLAADAVGDQPLTKELSVEVTNR